MENTTENFTAKLDENLQRIWSEEVFDKASSLPVIVRCQPASVSKVSSDISNSGARVRHELPLIGAVAAWLPLYLVPEVARREDVIALELEECFSIA